jgi:pantetheine-phosphate adenylyltransferase
LAKSKFIKPKFIKPAERPPKVSCPRIAVYPGSFDPITFGHIDIIQRISKQFDQVIVLISESPDKQNLFTSAERKAFIEESLPDLKNMKVDVCGGLTVDYCHEHQAQVIVRGLRAVVDFEYEITMASMNKKLAPDVETMLVFASPESYFISSRGVKEVARHGGALMGLVPEHVKKHLMKRLQNKSKK